MKKPTDEKTIRVLDAAWGKAATRKDLDAVVAFYAPNGTLVWPGQLPAHGTKAIRANWKTMMDTIPGLGLKFTAKRIVVSAKGDLASDFGVVTLKQDTATGPTTEIAKYLVVWIKLKGTWKVLYDSWNSNSAAG